MKLCVRVADKVFRHKKPIGIRLVLRGSTRCLNNGRPISYMGCSTGAGAIITGNVRILINGRPIARHTGRTKYGRTLTGSVGLLV